MSIELKFHNAMCQIYIQAQKECKYNANYFKKMLSEYGGLKTAKMLINKAEVTSGFEELRQCGRLDLTVEALVQKPEFKDLFTEDEIKKAKDRLRLFGYTID